MPNNNEKPCQTPSPSQLKEIYNSVNKTYTPVSGPLIIGDTNANYQPVAPQDQPVGSGARPSPPQGGSGVPSGSDKK
jgi:hypothetical protein